MDEDLVAAALRRDADRLFELAPPADAAALWHRVRRARARRLERIMDVCGWSARAAAATTAVGVALSSPDALPLFLGPFALALWLSTGICTPIAAARGARMPDRAPPGAFTRLS